jgi:hypothetical protein
MGRGARSAGGRVVPPAVVPAAAAAGAAFAVLGVLLMALLAAGPAVAAAAPAGMLRAAAASTAGARAPRASSAGSGGSVVAAPAVFHDDRCTAHGLTGASYAIPASVGVTYAVAGQALQAGVYPADDATTMTVVARPQPGYQLTGITQWTHTFPAAPQCSPHPPTSSAPPPVTSTPPVSASSSVPTTPSSSVPAGGHVGSPTSSAPAAGAGSSHGHHAGRRRHHRITPAYTGIVVTPIVLIGTGLLLLGIACQLVAGEPRRAKRAP